MQFGRESTMNLPTAARKILKAAHIASVGITVGGLVALLTLRAMKMSERWWPAGAAILDGVSVQLFDHLIQLGFYAVLLTAFLMALYTKWGFFQFWWVIGKWLLAALLFILAVYVLAPTLSGMSALSDTLAAGDGTGWNSYAAFETRELIILLGAFVVAAGLFLLSTLKPWGMRKGVNPASEKSPLRRRIIVSVLLLVVAVILVWGNAQIAAIRCLPAAPVEISSIPDGTYTGSAYLGFPYQVEVMVAGGRIIDAKALKNRDTFYSRLAELTLRKMVRDNRVDVDAVSGATTTGTALREAAENAFANGGTGTARIK